MQFLAPKKWFLGGALQFVALYSEGSLEPVFGRQKLRPKTRSVDLFFGGSMDQFFGASPSRLGTRPAELLGWKPKVTIANVIFITAVTITIVIIVVSIVIVCHRHLHCHHCP